MSERRINCACSSFFRISTVFFFSTFEQATNILETNNFRGENDPFVRIALHPNPRFLSTRICPSRWRAIVCETRMLCKCDLMLSRRRNPRCASHFRLFERAIKVLMKVSGQVGHARCDS